MLWCGRPVRSLGVLSVLGDDGHGVPGVGAVTVRAVSFVVPGLTVGKELDGGVDAGGDFPASFGTLDGNLGHTGISVVVRIVCFDCRGWLPRVVALRNDSEGFVVLDVSQATGALLSEIRFENW